MKPNNQALLDRLWDATTLSDWIKLFVLAAGAAWFVYWLRSRYLGDDDPAGCEHQLLAGLSDLRREGGLTEEEYRSIKGQLVKRIDGTERPHGDCGSPRHPEVSSVDREVDTDRKDVPIP